MSDYPPPPPPPPSEPNQPGGTNQYGQPIPPPPPYVQPAGGYGAVPPAAGVPRPGELLDRFLARLIDGVLFAVIYFILGAIFTAVLISSPSVNLSTGQVDDGSRVLYNLVFGVISTAISLGYFALMESSRGQTVGKMVMKLKVVTPSGGNPTLIEAAKRNIWLAIGLVSILGTIGSILNFVLSIAAIVLLVVGINSRPDRRTWFDKFAGDLQVLKIG